MYTSPSRLSFTESLMIWSCGIFHSFSHVLSLSSTGQRSSAAYEWDVCSFITSLLPHFIPLLIQCGWKPTFLTGSVYMWYHTEITQITFYTTNHAFRNKELLMDNLYLSCAAGRRTRWAGFGSGSNIRQEECPKVIGFFLLWCFIVFVCRLWFICLIFTFLFLFNLHCCLLLLSTHQWITNAFHLPVKHLKSQSFK